MQKLEGKMEGDSVVDEMLDTSVTDAAEEEQEEQMSEGQEDFMYLKYNVWWSLITNITTKSFHSREITSAFVVHVWCMNEHLHFYNLFVRLESTQLLPILSIILKS